MSEMPKQFTPADIEGPIFESWQKGRYFEQSIVEGKDPYTVVIPPPNVTGSLHMGHALNNTIQDVVIRKSRMSGRPTRWVIGTDHAGIATQNKVEQKIAKEMGKSRYDLGREEFVAQCWKWRDKHGSTIVEQLKRMGCSCDYSDEWFTMNESYQKAVREVFVDWFDKGLIYRGNRIINWCPRCTTALSDIEVEHEDKLGHLYHVRYPLTTPVEVDGALVTHATIATTRPETMLGDVAIAVHPEDERYKKLIGTTAILPLMDREIPIVADDYVDPAFGTGMVKITPAHDPNDFELGERHNLIKLNVMTEKAVINEEGGKYEGLDRYDAREQIVADLQEGGYLVEVVEHNHAVGTCYRCNTVVEPYLSDQWFVDMKPLAAPAIDAVRDGRVTFHPKRWENVYFHWMENIRDWCISRQLWWGHRIPVFYCDSCETMQASKIDIHTCDKCGGPLRQDEDVLDTWFSSQLWPFATLGWPNDDPRAEYFYPTSTLSTARDILFLWVARMIMSGMYFMDGEVPFKDVIIHPTVFNKEGRRMSKSLGTGVDPLDLMEHYGADGMRFGLMLQVTGVQDLKFDDDKLLSSRNFANKIWNAARFVLMNTEGYTPQAPQPTTVADRWILSRLAALTEKTSAGIDAYLFGEVARDLYEFFWSEFCDWYIELAKGRLQNGTDAERASVQSVLVYTLDKALRLLHPMMPFLTEEIWGRLPLEESDKAPSLMIAAWPSGDEMAHLIDPPAEKTIELIKAVIVAARATRARYGISPRDGLTVMVRGDASAVALLEADSELVTSLANISTLVLSTDGDRPANAAVMVAEGLEIAIPLEGIVDLGAERTRLEKEREKIQAELGKFNKKLSNPGFLAKAAPEIIEKDTAKVAELTEQVALIDAQIAELV